MREQEPGIVVLVTTSSSTVEAHCSEDDHRNQKNPENMFASNHFEELCFVKRKAL